MARMPLALLLAAALGCSGGGEQENAGSRPSLLLILVDALRRDHVGAYGYGRPTTPFLDQLAREGALFEKAFAQSPQTLNSTATLFTSRYFPLLVENRAFRPVPGAAASRQDRLAEIPALAEENLTLAEVFREAGYRTAAFFTNPHHHPTSGFAQGFRDGEYLRTGGGKPYAVGKRVNQAVFEWLEGRAEPGRPYFAYVHYMDVHNPYDAPRAYRERFVEHEARDRYTNGRPAEPLSPRELAFLRQSYDAEIRYADDRIRELVERLRSGSERPLLVAVVSDHGDEFLETGRLGHGHSMAKTVLAVPLLIHGPAVAPTRVETLARNLDVAPTLLELAGLRVPARFEGFAFAERVGPARGGASGRPPSSAYAWHYFLRSLATERWYLTWNTRSGAKRLYDGRSDPLGEHDVAGAHPDVVARLSREVEALEARKHRVAERAAALSEMDEAAGIGSEVREQLRALGYAD